MNKQAFPPWGLSSGDKTHAGLDLSGYPFRDDEVKIDPTEASQGYLAHKKTPTL